MLAKVLATTSVRMRLLLGWIGVTALALGASSWLAQRSSRAELLAQVRAGLDQQAAAAGVAVGDLVRRQVDVLRTLASTGVIRAGLEARDAEYEGDEAARQARAEAPDAAWRAAPDDDPLVRGALENVLATELGALPRIDPGHVEVFVTDRWGALVATTNRTSDWYQADEAWWQAAWAGGAGGVHVGRPELDESAGTFSINLAVPVPGGEGGRPLGVLRSTWQVGAALVPLLARHRVGATGRVDLWVSPTARLASDALVDEPDGALRRLIDAGATHADLVVDGAPRFVSRAPVRSPGDDVVARQGWWVLLSQSRAEALRPLAAATRTTWMVSLVALLAAALLATFLARQITRPLRRLRKAAQRIATGDLRMGDGAGAPAVVGRNEVAALAVAIGRLRDDLRGVIGEVQAAGIRMSSSTTQIAASARQLDAMVTEQHAATQAAAAATREISATGDDLARAMRDVAAATDATASAAAEGRSGLATLGTEVDTLVTAAHRIQGRLGAIEERTRALGGVLTALEQVVDQTNLLSINAAIEAEKAGEVGRGFTVVASEIQRLAERTAVAALEIEKTMAAMQAAVAGGVEEAERFVGAIGAGAAEIQGVGRRLGEVIEQIGGVAPRVEAVHGGVEEQSVGARQIRESMDHLDRAWTDTVSAVHETRNALDDLDAAAAGLRSAVARFSL